MNTQYGKVSEVLRFVQLAVLRSLPSQTKDSLEEPVKALSVQLPNVPASQATKGPSPCAPAGRAGTIEITVITKDIKIKRVRFKVSPPSWGTRGWYPEGKPQKPACLEPIS
jgi:hypothetical protein